MPRSTPPKSITLILPSASSSSSSASSSTMPNPPLEVLLAAQRIALSQGRHFNVEDFLTPSQRTLYHTTILHRSPPPTTAPLTPLDPSSSTSPIASSSKRPLELDSSSIDGPPDDRALKKPNIPGLQGLHWKQRQKKLAEIAKAEADAEAGKVEPDLIPESPVTGAVNGHGDKGKAKSDVETLPASASYWNHLLVEARKARGPQWDYHSQSFHFDRTSKEYYTHGKEPPADKPIVDVEPTAPSNSLGMSNGISHNNAVNFVPGQVQVDGHPGSSVPRRQSESRPSMPPSSSSMSMPPNRPTPTPQSMSGQLPSTSPYPHPQPGLPPSRTPLSHTNQLPPHQQQSQQPTPQQQFRPPQQLPPGMPSNLTPQQLASLTAFHANQSGANASGGGGGGFNPAMLAQMARPGGPPQPGQGQPQGQGQPGQPNLTPAQLAQMARMSQFQQQFLHQQPRPPPGGMTPQAFQQMNMQAMQARPGGMGGVNPGAMMGQAGQQVNPQMFAGMGGRQPSAGQVGMVGGQGGSSMGAGGNWQGYSS